MTDRIQDVSVGRPAPDFSVYTPLHGTVTLSDLRGRRHVAVVFFRTFATGNRLKLGKLRFSHQLCPTCLLMIRDLSRHYDRIQALDGEILAVSTVQPAELQPVLDSGEPRYPICADADGTVTRLYGVYDTLWQHPKPAAFLVDKQGIIRYRHVAEQQTDLPQAAELAERLVELSATAGR